MAPLLLFGLLGTLLFIGAIVGALQIAVWGLSGSIGLIGIGSILIDLKARSFNFNGSAIFLLYLLIATGLFFYTQPMTLSLIDEHAYWALIGKSLWFTHHLPSSGSPIAMSYTQNPPGMGLIHYFFFQLFGQYHESISYFAQSSALIACFFAIIQQKQLKQSICIAFLLLVLLNIQYGNVLARLDTNYLVSAMILSLAYLTHQSDRSLTLLPQLFLLTYLSLIHELGIWFSIALLILDIILNPEQTKRALITLIVLILFRFVWDFYSQQHSFAHFHLSEILNHFNPFNEEAQKIQGLFLHRLLIAPFDQLGIPGLLWMSGIIISGAFLCQFRSLELISISTRKANQVLIGLGLIFVVYLGFFYETEISDLGFGHQVFTLSGSSQALNLGFSQVGLWAIFMLLSRYFERYACKKSYQRILLLSLGFIVYSYYHRLSVAPEFALGQEISTNLHQRKPLPAPGTQVLILMIPDDATLRERYAIQLRYYLLDMNIDIKTRYTGLNQPAILGISDKKWSWITPIP